MDHATSWRSCKGSEVSAETRAGMALYPFTRRNYFSAWMSPEPTQCMTIAAPFQRFTRPENRPTESAKSVECGLDWIGGLQRLTERAGDAELVHGQCLLEAFTKACRSRFIHSLQPFQDLGSALFASSYSVMAHAARMRRRACACHRSRSEDRKARCVLCEECSVG